MPPTETIPQPANPFSEWALVELMGHQRIAGHCTEQSIAGANFLRVDVPEVPGVVAFTRFYGASAIYAINPVSEQIARHLAANMRNQPVQRYELMQIGAPAGVPEHLCIECNAPVSQCVCHED